jgi:hypothetical protein
MSIPQLRRSVHSAILAAAAVVLPPLSHAPADGQVRILDGGGHSLRMGAGAEWSETAGRPHARDLTVRFSASPNREEHTLVVRQEGVKQSWRILLNGRELAPLRLDENPMVAYTPIPAGVLVSGENQLRIEPGDTLPDDIVVGPIALREAPLREVLSEATLDLTVLDESGGPLPARFTITSADGALQEVAAAPGAPLAIRPGFVYAGTGRATVTVPEGEYTVYASRGFEYGVDSARVGLSPGDRASRTLRIRREVPTEGWVSSDTHVHTLTHSGHGDATAEERVLTLAGEGIELPIVTEHNVHVDLDSVAVTTGVREHFTPVVGNELTTPIGHFNLFPVELTGRVASPRVGDWEEVAEQIGAAHGGVVILNHGRDIHSDFRPFGAERQPALGVADREGWTLPANAMEIMNSGAQQSDPLELFHDWLAMLNAGHRLAPVGSSDSHDVARFIVGQARTYIRVADEDPGRVDVTTAVERFRAGAVMVSFGLLAELAVDGRYGPGDVVPPGAEMEVAVRVLGPAWTRAERVSLYLNGERIRTREIEDNGKAGVKWSGSWRVPRPPGGAHLVALAEGPDPRRPWWPIAKPYQPTSPEVRPVVMGVSGAVRVGR